MLALLSFWREQCDQAELAAYEQRLEEACHGVIGRSTLNNRYQGSYHRALINGKFIRAAIRTDEREHQDDAWVHGDYLGEILARKLANQGGHLACDSIEPRFKNTLASLLQRGVLFEHDGQYCLPAEAVIELVATDTQANSIELATCTSSALLLQLVPTDAQQTMLRPKPTSNELAAWLAVQSEQARNGPVGKSLDEDDWSLLLELQHQDLEDFDRAQTRYLDLPRIQITHHYYYNDKQEFSLRKALELSIPEQICKLCRLGLIGITTRRTDQSYACIRLSIEGRAALAPHWQKARKRMIAKLQAQWQASPCEPEEPSPWSMDQQIWRLWIALHFLPAGITQQKRLRKIDLKKIASVLNSTDLDSIEFFIASMISAGLLKPDEGLVQPEDIDWPAWSTRMRAFICETLHGWDRWTGTEEKKAIRLLSELPVNCWLKLDEVMDWLRMQSDGKLVSAQWMSLFIEYQTLALHHRNTRKQCIYLLPLFRAVLNQQTIVFPAPGWHGADKKAKIHGFISAAGEIQLPPDCAHSILPKLAAFCTIISVEQMITLQLDVKALQRMATDKAALKRSRSVLESVQSPLPQAVAYMFDKQQSQKAVAAVAATSLMVFLHEPSALRSLRKMGFSFCQPFKDKPEIMLLDASGDAHAFIKACAEGGIMLDILIKPVQWISGTASVKAWMEINIEREDHWLEVCYQKTRSSQPKQVIACIEYDYYDKIQIRAVHKAKQGFVFLKTTVTLEPRHILRLRELDAAEVEESGLDKLP